jgi:hypothetical protein
MEPTPSAAASLVTRMAVLGWVVEGTRREGRGRLEGMFWVDAGATLLL